MTFRKIIERLLPQKKEAIPNMSNTQYSKPSYSQCGEDCIVDFILSNILLIEKPNYIDVGAFHPFIFSNTCMFYKKGGLGLNIEPNPSLFQELLLHRPENINLNIGIDTVSGIKDYFMFNESALNSFDPKSKDLPNRTLTRVAPIKLSPLSEIVQEYFCDIPIDFLSVDVEGLDLLVIESLNLNVNRPKVICVETIQEIAKDEWSKNFELIEFLGKHDYLLHSSTMINSIFIDKKLMTVKLSL